MTNTRPSIKERLGYRVKAARRWYRQSEFITWSRLATFGNNPLVKLTILAPLLAQVLIHKDTIVFLAQYDFKNIGYLYASLMSFFVAQLIYTARCDRDIKDYPSEVKYIQALDTTTSDEYLNCQYFNVYKMFFKKYGGSIDHDHYDFEKARHYATKKDLQITKSNGAIVSKDAIDQNRRYLDRIIRSIHRGKQIGLVDWKLLTSIPDVSFIDMLQIERTEDESDGYTPEEGAVYEMIFNAGEEFRSSHWRAVAIKRQYDKLNTSRLLARSIAATLYAL